LVAFSLDSSEEENGRHEEKQKIDHAKEAQLAHQKMCQKAIDTMNNVNDLLTTVRQGHEIRKKKAMFLLHICSCWAVLSYLIEVFQVHLTHFDH